MGITGILVAERSRGCPFPVPTIPGIVILALQLPLPVSIFSLDKHILTGAFTGNFYSRIKAPQMAWIYLPADCAEHGSSGILIPCAAVPIPASSFPPDFLHCSFFSSLDFKLPSLGIFDFCLQSLPGKTHPWGCFQRLSFPFQPACVHRSGKHENGIFYLDSKSFLKDAFFSPPHKRFPFEFKCDFLSLHPTCFPGAGISRDVSIFEGINRCWLQLLFGFLTHLGVK